MAKFKVGDIIKANKKSNKKYFVTTQKNGWTGIVLEIQSDSSIGVVTLTPKRDKGKTYIVEEAVFDLVEDKQNLTHIVNKNAVIVILGDKETEAKLLAEPSEPVKEEPKFKVGELVRIRQWDDMEKEFGTNILGNINTQQGFLRKMEPLCGKYAEITELDNGNMVLLKFFNCDGLEYLTEVFDFATDVIEKV